MGMNSREPAVSDSRRKPSAIMAIALMAWVTNAGANRPHLAVTTGYYNISVEQLISVYKAAYIEFGHEFVEKKVSGNSTELVFNFPNPDYPDKKKGYLSLSIDAEGGDNKNCAPCRVSTVVSGGEGWTDYSLREWGRLVRKMNIADKQAKDKINAQLSPNVSLPPPPQGGDGPDDYYDYHYHIGYEELGALYKKAYLEAGFKLRDPSFLPFEFTYSEVEDKKRSLLYFTFSVPEHKKQHGVFVIEIYSSSPPDQMCDPCNVRRDRHLILDNDKGSPGQTRAADDQARAQIREQMRAADDQARAQIRLALKSMRPPAPAEQGTKPAAQ